MAARALLALFGHSWLAPKVQVLAGALLIAELIDHTRYLQRFAADYRKALSKRKRGRRRR